MLDDVPGSSYLDRHPADRVHSFVGFSSRFLLLCPEKLGRDSARSDEISAMTEREMPSWPFVPSCSPAGAHHRELCLLEPALPQS